MVQLSVALAFVSVVLVASASQATGSVSSTDPYQMDYTHYSRDCELVDGELVCHQRKGAAGAIRVGCVGDSITAVGHTSSVAHHYPDQMQDILDAKHGNGTYSVTNLGVCGSTMQKAAHKPWWNTGAYKTLVANKWDVIVGKREIFVVSFYQLLILSTDSYAWNERCCSNRTRLLASFESRNM
jgi:hypothetical protein